MRSLFQLSKKLRFLPAAQLQHKLNTLRSIPAQIPSNHQNALLGFGLQELRIPVWICKAWPSSRACVAIPLGIRNVTEHEVLPMVVVTVMVADPSELVRCALCTLLSYEPKIEVVGEAHNFDQLIRIARSCKPQIIVLDLQILHRAPDDFKSQLPVDISSLLTTSLAYDVKDKLLAVCIGAAVLLDKTKLVDELIPTIKRLTAPHSETAAAD